MTALSKTMSINSIFEAKEDIRKFNEWRAEIGEDVNDIELRIETVKKKLAENVYDEKQKTGYLRNRVEDFFSCLKLNTVKLMDLMEDELRRWQNELKKTEDRMAY